MENTWQSFSDKALPFTYQANHRLRTQPDQNLYTTPKNFGFQEKKLQLGSKKTKQSNASKPRNQYMCFQREKSKGIKDRYVEKFVESKQKEAAQQKMGGIQKIKPHYCYSKTEKISGQLQSNFRERTIYTIKSNVSPKQKQIRNYIQPIKNQYSEQEYTTQKMQITFNMQSTEPDQPEKQPNSQYYNFQISNKIKINRDALQIWKKRKMERQIKQKERQYRSLIRCLSRKSQKQKSVIKNKMKEVLDQLFVLTKQVKK